ncbi:MULTISPECIES: hypothetical protein [unclassified Gordonia (in: high G+C Gram-positive bacteria)]|nr:hypothetical protein [Gordonia sp. PP30]
MGHPEPHPTAPNHGRAPQHTPPRRRRRQRVWDRRHHRWIWQWI